MKFKVKDLYYGFLHMLVVLTATVLIGSICSIPTPLVFFTTGLGTLLFTLTTRGRLGISLGLSGAWVGTILSVAPLGLGYMAGTTLLGGAIYMAVGYAIRKNPKVLKIFNPMILNMAVLFIALSLINTSVGILATAPWTAIVTIIGIGIASMNKRTEALSFPIGIALGTLFHAIAYGLTPTVYEAFVPSLVVPQFSVASIMASIVAVFILTESLGDSKLVADSTGNKYEPDKVIIGNGVATFVAGLFGGMPVTTYSESCGYVVATKNNRWQSVIITGLLFMIMAFIPQVSTLVSYIPIEALAGVLMYLFTMVATTKIQALNFKNPKTVLLGISGLSAFYIAPIVFPNISQIAIAMIVLVVVNALLKLKR